MAKCYSHQMSKSFHFCKWISFATSTVVIVFGTMHTFHKLWLYFFSQNHRFKKKSCIGSLFCYRRYSILLLRVSPIDCVFCFLPSSYSSRCRMLRTRLLSINMTSVDELSKAEPLDSAPTYLQPHYGNGVCGNVYLLALDNTKRQTLTVPDWP